MRKLKSGKITKRKYLRRRPHTRVSKKRSYKKRQYMNNLDLDLDLDLDKSSDIVYMNDVSNKVRTNKLNNSAGNIILGLREL